MSDKKQSLEKNRMTFTSEEALMTINLEAKLNSRYFPFVSESVARWTNLNDHVSGEQVRGGHCFMQEHPADAARLVSAQLLPRLDAVSA